MGIACWTRIIDDDDNIKAMAERAVSLPNYFFRCPRHNNNDIKILSLSLK